MVTPDRLREYLAAKMPEVSELRIEGFSRFKTGMSYETYGFSVTGRSNAGAVKRDYVLRMEPESGPLEPYDVSHQYFILKALQASPVPVPAVLWLERDPAALGRPFFIMERIDGEIPVPWKTAPDSSMEDPAQRSLMSEQFLRVLADLHAADWRSLELSSFPVPAGPEDFARRVLARWAGLFEQAELRPQPVLWEARRWLASRIPRSTDTTLVHGDYRVGNFVWRDERIVAMLDWEDAAIGDPVSDLGWICNKLFRREGLIACFFTRDELLRRYEEMTGRRVDRESLRWWEAMGYFKLAAMHVSNVKAMVTGARRDARLINNSEFGSLPIWDELAQVIGF